MRTPTELSLNKLFAQGPAAKWCEAAFSGPAPRGSEKQRGQHSRNPLASDRTLQESTGQIESTRGLYLRVRTLQNMLISQYSHKLFAFCALCSMIGCAEQEAPKPDYLLTRVRISTGSAEESAEIARREMRAIKKLRGEVTELRFESDSKLIELEKTKRRFGKF